MINKILDYINEDKSSNFSTTSNKFKTDLWNFFSNEKFKNKICVEFGTHKGQTTRVLSHLFKKVYTINFPLAGGDPPFDKAKSLNHDVDNIEYLLFDLYSNPSLNPPVNGDISVFFIDAGHEYENVISDMNRAFSMNCDKECYVVFDDYGLNKWKYTVKKAVDEAIEMGAIKIIKEIGHPKGYDFGSNRILEASEGLITKIIWS